MNLIFLVLVGVACLMSALLGATVQSFVVSPNPLRRDNVMTALLMLVLASVLVGETFCWAYWR